uniref:Uncharacterized protein n=1 Tax=Arundo donax TaxID=35708 RepID=A0A0A9CFH2_ARUDO
MQPRFAWTRLIFLLLCAALASTRIASSWWQHDSRAHIFTVGPDGHPVLARSSSMRVSQCCLCGQGSGAPLQ